MFYGIPGNSTDILIVDPIAGTATRSAMGADLAGSNKWSGGALGADGKLYGAPGNSTDILVIDPVAGTATRTPMGVDLTGTNKWAGAVAAPNGKVYAIPLDAADILVIDTATGTAERTTMGASMSAGGGKWFGGILAPNGLIYGIPHSGSDVLIINPATGTATRNNFGVDFSGGAKWAGAVLGADGKIYGIPLYSENILIIDPVAGTATRSLMGGSALTGPNKWYGGALGSNGRIYGLPFDSPDILIINTAAGIATRETLGLDASDTGKWYGGVAEADDLIYGIPYHQNTILRINPVAGTVSRPTLGANLTGSNKWNGAIVSGVREPGILQAGGTVVTHSTVTGTATGGTDPNDWSASTVILGRLEAAAVFALDDCMRPIYGPNGGVVDQCFAAFSSSDNMDEGEAFTRRCADGKILFFDPGEATLQSVTVNLDLNAEPDEGFMSQVGLVQPVMSGTTRIGWTRCTSSTANVLIAIWQEVLGVEGCDTDGGAAGWRLHLFPVRRARLTLEGAIGAEDGYIRITGSTAASAALGRGPIPLLGAIGGATWPESDLHVCHHTVLTNNVAPPPSIDGAIDTVAPTP